MQRFLKKLSRLFSSKPHCLSNHERRIFAIEDAGDSETALVDKTSYFNRAITYFRLGNMDQTIEALTQVIALQPNNAEFYRLRAIALIHTGLLAQALSDAFQALMLTPDDAANYGTLTTCYLALGKHDEALINALKQAELATAKGDKSGITAAHLGQAMIHYDRHEREKALTLWRAIVDDNADYRDYDSVRLIYYFTPSETAIVRQLFEEAAPQSASTLS